MISVSLGKAISKSVWNFFIFIVTPLKSWVKTNYGYVQDSGISTSDEGLWKECGSLAKRTNEVQGALCGDEKLTIY